MEKDKLTESDEVKRKELGKKLANLYTESIDLGKQRNKVINELREVSPIKINDLVKIHGQRNKYIVKSVKPHLDNKHKLQFMFDLLQEDSDVNYKYNVGTCQITKIK